MPALALGIFQVANAIERHQVSWANLFPSVLGILSATLIYMIEADRLGMIFVVCLVLLGIYKIVRGLSLTLHWKKLLPAGVLALAFLVVTVAMLKNNAQWKTFFSDAKIAVQVDRYDNWKYPPEYLPINELGVKASDSNYKRIAWLIVGTRLSIDQPLGYGLMSQSFGRLCKQIWPESQTSWTHNAWLDFALGYGLPGFFLLFAAALMAWHSSQSTRAPWNSLGTWVLGLWIALFFVKELASEVYINAFIFMLVFCRSLNLFSAVAPHLAGRTAKSGH